jgi:endonuclease YncB( thermonuclease family)
VVDGDTQHLAIDYGYRMSGEHSIRLLGIDCPEINRGTIEEKARGQAAKQFARDWYHQHSSGAEWPLWIASEKADSFGRWLGDVFSDSGAHLSDDLLAAGHAKATR